jgi:pimeloyl-ACP methyl ester carboxylesterase
MASNNTWLKITDSPTAIVFVHGILSDSDCWKNKKFGTYWPNMVAEDQAFGNISVFLSGYTANLGAGLYDTFDAAEEVMVHLRTSQPSVLSKSNLLFICHSQGGIVVRQMLCSKWQDFAQKKVGIVLCGSPSWGSIWASIFVPITLLIKFRQGSALKWGGATLVTLDRQFLDLIDAKRIADLSGMSLVETKGPFLLPPIVSDASATRYFPTWKRIPNARHGDIIRPHSLQDLSHKFLTDFARSKGFLDDQRLQSPALAGNKDRIVSVPQSDFAEQVKDEFVGRVEMRHELSDLIARLKQRRGTVYWAHGFGGMGKSFLLRRAFLDVPSQVKKALVDWDDQTNRFRKPLRNSPTSLADLFDALAYAFHGAFDSRSFDRYWVASDVVRESETRRAGFERRFDMTVEELIKILSQQPPEDFPQASNYLPDHLETQDDLNRQAERECLLALISDEPKVRKVLARLRRVRRNREEFFDQAAWEILVERWINGVAPTEEEHVRDPGGYLARRLCEITMEHLERHEFVLLLDTLEVLSQRLDRQLCQFLATITNSGFPLLTIIASRFEPDSRLPGGSFSGWHDMFGGRIKTEAFGRNARFTPTDVR